MLGVPADRSGRFRLAALGIIFLAIVIRLPSMVHPQAIDSEAMYSVVANEIVARWPASIWSAANYLIAILV